MSANPTRQVISGIGRPRIIRELLTPLLSGTASATYTATSVNDPGIFTGDVMLGMRIQSWVVVGAFTYGTWAKITSIDLGTGTVEVDEWTNGTPTNAQIWQIDGYIADLPFTLEGGLVETFEPNHIVHNLFRFRKSVKDFGYSYSASLDYTKRSSPDDFYELRFVMQSDLEGSQDNLVLIPRRDKLGINYNVYLSEPFNIILHESRRVHKGFVLKFKGKDSVASPPHFRFSGYGTHFANDYGRGL